MPETALAFQYQGFLMKTRDPDTVGLMIGNYETWMKSYGGENETTRQRALLELLNSFEATGHPKHLCRCFGKKPETTKGQSDPGEAARPSPTTGVQK